MVLYISTGYRVLGIVCLDQLKGSRHTHISYHNIRTVPGQVQHSIGRVIKWSGLKTRPTIFYGQKFPNLVLSTWNVTTFQNMDIKSSKSWMFHFQVTSFWMTFKQ